MSKDQSLPHQAAEFLIVSHRDHLSSDPNTTNIPIMYIPLSNKLSLHKNKKKRLGGAPKRSVFGDDDDDAPKYTKISEKVADQYVLAARGYSAKEVQDANLSFKELHCETEISKESSGAVQGVRFFRSSEELQDCQKNERKYLKNVLKKFKK